jgi:hypothetical protein
MCVDANLPFMQWKASGNMAEAEQAGAHGEASS